MNADKAGKVVQEIGRLGLTRLSSGILAAGDRPYKANLEAVRELVVFGEEELGAAALREMVNGIGPWAKAFEAFGKASDLVAEKVEGAILAPPDDGLGEVDSEP
jgi:hypothetical protein